jgi:hypothetical protein
MLFDRRTTPPPQSIWRLGRDFVLFSSVIFALPFLALARLVLRKRQQ